MATKQQYSSPEMQQRKKNLLQSIAKLQDKLKTKEDDPKAPAIRNRIQEHLDTIRNIEDYGQESKPTGNQVGVNIGVPQVGG